MPDDLRDYSKMVSQALGVPLTSDPQWNEEEATWFCPDDETELDYKVGSFKQRGIYVYDCETCGRMWGAKVRGANVVEWRDIHPSRLELLLGGEG